MGVLGQEDASPDGGAAQGPVRPRFSKASQVSRDSPFSTQLDVPLVPRSDEQATVDRSREKLIGLDRRCTIAAARAIAAPADAGLRPLHSKIAQEAVLKERHAQLVLKEQLRIARMRDEVRWADVGRQEGEQSAEVLQSESLAWGGAKREPGGERDRPADEKLRSG
jgi:hypothetical protein